MRRKIAVSLFKQVSFKFYLNLAVALAVLGSAGVVLALPSNTGLVAHWSFDQSSGTTLLDDSGNGRNGTFSGTPTWTAGRINNALGFDGTDMVSLGNITQINNVPKLTLATWMKRNNAGAMVLVGKQTSNQDVAIEAWSDGKVYFQMSRGADTYGTITLNDTAWHHVTMVFDGTLSGNANRLKAYVDGVQKTMSFKGTVPTTTTANTTPFNIGRMGADYSNGLVDDTWLYARALNQTEVQDLMQISSAPDTTPPTVPANLNASAVSQTQINLSWSASTDNVGVTGYRVFRNGVERTTTTSPTFQDTGLAPGTTYFYTVRAYDLMNNQSADSAVASVATQAPDTTAPVVALTAPVNGSTVSGTINLSATATDNVTVNRVVFTVDGVQQGANDTSAPYGTTLDTTTLVNGSHTVRATAFDNSGNSAHSEVIVTVDNQVPPADNTPPVVALTAPVDAATLSGNVQINANASDDTGVLGVKFYADGNQIGSEDSTAPYSVNWNTASVANGAVQLTALARDAAGNTMTSPVVAVTINNQVPVGASFVTGVSSNGRYFVDQHSAPILVKGDSPWSMFSDLSPAQVEQWAANRESHGFNAAIVSLVGSLENGGPSNTGATYDGVLPFNGGNITSWNEAYWVRMDSYLTTLQNHGITAFLYPMDGWNTHPGGTFYHKSAADSYTYGQMVGNRLASHPNIVWMVGGDYQYYDDLAVNVSFQNLLAGIRSTGDNRLFSVQHTLESLSTDVAAYEPIANWNFGYTYSLTYDVILDGYNRAPSARDPRPVLFGEGNYEGEGAWDGIPTTNETLRRQQLWTLTSGGAGEFTGSQDWMFGAGWENRLDTTWITQAQKMRNFFGSLNWQLLVPDSASPLVTAGRGTRASAGNLDVLQNDYVTAAQTPDRSQTVVYVPTSTGGSGNARTITLDLAKLPASYTATWVDPTDATTSVSATINGAGQVTTPAQHSDGTRDWLLVIR